MIILAVFLPLLFALIVPMLSKFKNRIHTGIFVLIVPLLVFSYFIQFVKLDFQPIVESTTWIPSLSINFDFYLDGLSLLFALLISGIGSLVVFYSIFYMEKSEKLNHFYVYLLLFMGAMLGVTLSDNIFALYTFWELTSISSFLLIGYWHHRKASRYGALKSMTITVFGGLSLLGGFITLSSISGTTSIQGMIEQSDLIFQSPYLYLAIVFILLGAFTKSAQFPFHIWLPDAMEAPTPVSTYLHSATMVKAGIYLVARFSPLFSEIVLFVFLVSLIGAITLVWGSFNAVKQTDLKGILAFSTISQLGMIMMLFGIGSKLAVFAAVLHIINHATFKASLFMVAGIIDVQTGTRDIRKLGGLFALMPITGVIALIGTLSMAGVPLPILNGFYSKELILESAFYLPSASSTIVNGLFQVLPYLVVFGSIFTFVYSLYLVYGVFFGKLKENSYEERPQEAKAGILISPIILGASVVLLGLLPNLLNNSLLSHTANAIARVTYNETIQFWHGLNLPFMMTLVIIFVGTILLITRNRWNNIYQVFPKKLTLNHLYDGLTNGIQPVTSRITNTYMNGSLRLYMTLILAAIVIGTGFTIISTNGFVLDTSNLAEVTILEIVIICAMVVAAIATLFQNHHLSAILILGIVGFGTAMLFVLYRAPDLALTQLVIETITVVLFLLTFRHLPKLRKRTEKVKTKLLHLLVSIGFGGTLTIVAISSHSSRSFEKISEYFIQTADTIGGGTNIVNVILVDMRGFDTLFEIAVLAIAALAIHALVRIKSEKEID